MQVKTESNRYSSGTVPVQEIEKRKREFDTYNNDRIVKMKDSVSFVYKVQNTVVFRSDNLLSRFY